MNVVMITEDEDAVARFSSLNSGVYVITVQVCDTPRSTCSAEVWRLKGNSGIFKPGPYFWHEIRSSTHREQFGESRRPSEDI